MSCPQWAADTVPLLAEIHTLRAARSILLGMAERVASQSEILKRLAEREPHHFTDGGGI